VKKYLPLVAVAMVAGLVFSIVARQQIRQRPEFAGCPEGSIRVVLIEGKIACAIPQENLK